MSSCCYSGPHLSSFMNAEWEVSSYDKQPASCALSQPPLHPIFISLSSYTSTATQRRKTLQWSGLGHGQYLCLNQLGYWLHQFALTISLFRGTVCTFLTSASSSLVEPQPHHLHLAYASSLVWAGSSLPREGGRPEGLGVLEPAAMPDSVPVVTGVVVSVVMLTGSCDSLVFKTVHVFIPIQRGRQKKNFKIHFVRLDS